jgi:carbonic anhydrase
LTESSPIFPERLLTGYASFRENRLPVDRARYRVLADVGQRAEIMVIGCSDSRAAPELIFDAAPGELFVLRNVANLIPPYDPDGQYHGTSAAIEFGVMNLRVRHVLVMGHGRCGGIAAFLGGRRVAAGGPQGDFLDKWMSLVAPAAALVADEPGDDAARQRALEFASVRQGIGNLRTFPYIRSLEEIGELALHGAWFDISTGELLVLDASAGQFQLVTPDVPVTLAQE